MPIRPENKARYPANWKSEIRPSILARAGNCCEGSPDYPDCRRPNGAYLNKVTGDLTDDEMQVEEWTAVDGVRVTRIVLTIGHLDHIPENCDPSNLKAWCQRCHLHYDRHHHANTRQQTKMVKANMQGLFASEGGA